MDWIDGYVAEDRNSLWGVLDIMGDRIVEQPVDCLCTYTFDSGVGPYCSNCGVITDSLGRLH